MWVEQISPSWAKKERKHLLQASLALWDIYSVLFCASTLIAWTRCFYLKKPEPLFPVWLLCKMLLPLRLLSRVAFLITHLLGLCQPFKEFTFNYSSVPLSGHQGNASNNGGGSAADEDVSSQILSRRVKRHTGTAPKVMCKVKSDHFRSVHSHLPSSLPLEQHTSKQHPSKKFIAATMVWGNLEIGEALGKNKCKYTYQPHRIFSYVACKDVVWIIDGMVHIVPLIS